MRSNALGFISSAFKAAINVVRMYSDFETRLRAATLCSLSPTVAGIFKLMVILQGNTKCCRWQYRFFTLPNQRQQDPGEEDVGEGDGQDALPAEAHELVVTEAG